MVIGSATNRQVQRKKRNPTLLSSSQAERFTLLIRVPFEKFNRANFEPVNAYKQRHR